LLTDVLADEDFKAVRALSLGVVALSRGGFLLASEVVGPVSEETGGLLPLILDGSLFTFGRMMRPEAARAQRAGLDAVHVAARS
jgi:hypothetical protein